MSSQYALLPLCDICLVANVPSSVMKGENAARGQSKHLYEPQHAKATEPYGIEKNARPM